MHADQIDVTARDQLMVIHIERPDRPCYLARLGDWLEKRPAPLGYGSTAERRTALDPSIQHEVDVVEAVIREAGGPVHLVGHSFGGLVAVATALRNLVPLASLTVVEAPAAELLRDRGDQRYHAFRIMTEDYFAAFAGGDKEAIARMIDFYGGAGTFASWPPRARAYALETTAVNILDWASAYGFALSASALETIDVPALVLCGGDSHPAVQRANASKVSIPRQSRGLYVVSRSKRLLGVAGAPPMCGPPEGGSRIPDAPRFLVCVGAQSTISSPIPGSGRIASC